MKKLLLTLGLLVSLTASMLVVSAPSASAAEWLDVGEPYCVPYSSAQPQHGYHQVQRQERYANGQTYFRTVPTGNTCTRGSVRIHSDAGSLLVDPAVVVGPVTPVPNPWIAPWRPGGLIFRWAR